MTHRQARKEILELGWFLLAQTSYPNGVRYEASDGNSIARGDIYPSPDDAMASCLRAVLSKGVMSG